MVPDAPRVMCARYLPPIMLTIIFLYNQNRSEIRVSRRRLADGLYSTLGSAQKKTYVLAPAELVARELGQIYARLPGRRVCHVVCSMLLWL